MNDPNDYDNKYLDNATEAYALAEATKGEVIHECGRYRIRSMKGMHGIDFPQPLDARPEE